MAAFQTNQINATRGNFALANGTDTAAYRWRDGRSAPPTVRVSISGTFTGTLSVQVCDPGSTSGYEVDTATAAESILVQPGGDCDIVVKFSAYTSGTANVNIYAGITAG